MDNIFKKGFDYSLITDGSLPEPYREYIKIMGLENFLKLIRQFGGKTIYIPKDGYIERIVLTETLKREHAAGKSIQQLSEQYGLNRSTVYSMIGK